MDPQSPQSPQSPQWCQRHKSLYLLRPYHKFSRPTELSQLLITFTKSKPQQLMSVHILTVYSLKRTKHREAPGRERNQQSPLHSVQTSRDPQTNSGCLRSLEIHVQRNYLGKKFCPLCKYHESLKT
jgi:hypothetical protein